MVHIAKPLSVVVIVGTVVANSCLSCGAATVQQKPSAQNIVTTVSVDDFVARVSSAPPEIATDLLIRIAESKLIRDKQKKINLLPDAFVRSSDVQKKIRMKRWSGLVDTPSGYLSAAYDLKLDELSLKTRVVNAMLNLDSERARTLFSEIPRLEITPLSCSDVLTYDVSAFYETLGRVADKAFTSREKTEGSTVRFIQSYLKDVVSPAELPSAIDMIVNVRPSTAEWNLLKPELISTFKRIHNDPRSFAVSMTSGRLANSFERLLATFRELDFPTQQLMSSFRDYVLAQLSTGQCTDMLVGGQNKNGLNAEFLRVNTWFAEPISEDDLKNAKVSAPTNDTSYWSSSDSKRFLFRVKELRFGKGEKPIEERETKTPEWQQNMRQLLNDIGSWNGFGEASEADFFHQKCSLFETLFNLAQTDALRVEVMLGFANYLRSSSIQEKSRIEWLFHAYSFIKRTQSLGAGRTKIMDVFRNSSSQALQLYSEFDEITSASIPGAVGRK
jgi:hypothetical protein